MAGRGGRIVSTMGNAAREWARHWVASPVTGAVLGAAALVITVATLTQATDLWKGVLLALVAVALVGITVNALYLRARVGDPYEILSCAFVWDFETKDTAIGMKTIKLKSLQHGVMCYRDWSTVKYADADITVEPSPARLCDQWADAPSGYQYLISFRKPMKLGEIRSYTIKRTVFGKFPDPDESVTLSFVVPPPSSTRIVILFPPDRSARSAQFWEGSRDDGKEIDVPVSVNADGRLAAQYTVSSPKRDRTYSLSWRW